MTTDNLPVVQNNPSLSLGMPNAQEFQMLQIIAKNAQDSGLYATGVGQQPKILMVLLAARELGVSPMLALNGGIWNIQGKIEISARLMNGLIRRAGHSIKIIVSNDEICKLVGTRNDNGDSFECSFSMADANKAGLSGGNVWKKYPADMLYNRCMSRLARRLFPDVIGTSYVEGEIREAKELEDAEKQAIFIPHEEIEKKEPVFASEPLINNEQLFELTQGLAMTDDIFRKNYDNFMKEKWNASKFTDLPLRAYAPTMVAIKRNIELNSQKQKVI